MLAYLRSNFIPYFFLVWVINIGIVQFILFHYINKLICKKYSFELEKKGLIWLFPHKKYNKINSKLFYKKLITAKELHNNKGDIKLLKKLKKEINMKGEKPITSYIFQSYLKKAIPIITSIFMIYAALILEKSTDFVSDSKLVLAYSFFLLVAVFLAIYFDKIILDILNVKYRQQQRYSKRVSKLKVFLELKYTRKNKKDF